METIASFLENPVTWVLIALLSGSFSVLFFYLRRKWVLVIEDSTVDQLYLNSQIKLNNADITYCSSLEEARPFIVKRPDAVIVDEMLPGYRGSQVLPHCRRLGIPALLVTSDKGCLKQNHQKIAAIKNTPEFIPMIKAFLRNNLIA